MQPFLGPDFLLDTAPARQMYHETAKDLPIIDYHNHLDPQAIAEDQKWDTLGRIWLEGDHYKWRAMRWVGIDERRVTGSASFREKYEAFALTIPQCLGNPLYHWTHMELHRIFGMEGVIFSPETAEGIWEKANHKLQQDAYSARGLLRQANVELVGTTDDPCDTLEHHRKFAGSPSGFKMVPSFRPDKAMKIAAEGFPAYLEQLASASAIKVTDFDSLLEALENRLNHFIAHGCKASDHGLDSFCQGTERSPAILNQILDKRLSGLSLSEEEAADFAVSVLVSLGRLYAKNGLVMQLHIGAQRNNRSHLFKTAGPDAGGDSISDRSISGPLNRLLDSMDKTGELPRTILYALDPTRNEVIVTTAGNFQDGHTPGKVQAGSGWWFNDQLDGMERQMIQLSQMGLLFHFVGMLTDSRSFLSFPRHEYFRRLLCRMVGRWMEQGAMPADIDMASHLIRRVCYENARDWFCPVTEKSGSY